MQPRRDASTDRVLTLACPAKINLALSVGAARADGYHPIASWMVALDFADTLELRWAEDGGSRFDIAFAEDAPVREAVDWPIEKDLAWRAHALMQEIAGRPLPVTARLRKRVPTGAGLGGGSSDAAAMLVGLNRLFALELTEAGLRQAAGRLGCDVAFLVAALHGTTSALSTGLGECITPAPLAEPIHLALVLPPFGCPTRRVYAAFDELGGEGEADEARVRALAGERPVAAELFNDLAEPACRAQPRLRSARDTLQGVLSQRVHVTGSGAAMFVLTATAEEAVAMAQRIRAATGYAAVAACSLRGR